MSRRAWVALFIAPALLSLAYAAKACREDSHRHDVRDYGEVRK